MTQKDSAIVRYLRDPSLLLEDALEHARQGLELGVAAAPFLLPPLLALVLARFLVGRLRERRLAAGARLIAVGVPPEVEPEGALLLWSALHDLLRPRLARLLRGQPQLAWEIAAGRGGSEFRIWIPETVPPGLVERALAATWPGITTATLPAEADLSATAASREAGSGKDEHSVLLPGAGEDETLAAGELVLSGSEWFPLGGRDGPDPLRLVLGQLAGLATGERALVQVVIRPATAREQRRLVAAARRIRNGASPSRIGRLVDLVLPGQPARPPGLDPTVNPDVRAVLEKASHPLYRCLVRVAVSAPDMASARGRIHALSGAFAGYEGRVGLRRRHVRAARRKLRLRALGRRGYLLSIPELAGLAHLPSERALPGLVRAGARSVAPPPGLPAEGKPLGLAASGEQVALAVADARYHLHLLGPTGVGKSTLVARLALADLESGRGAVVIDPKGDLVEEILERIPAGLEGRVDLLDPLDPAPPGLNVLEGSDHDLVVDQLVGIFRRVYERFWGPRTDDILRAALLTLLAAGGQATLADVPRLLSDEHWREQLLLEFEDPVGLEPFWEWYDGLGEAVRTQATGPVLNKLRAFLLRRPVRAIVGQERSTIDVAGTLDGGGLLLVRVPKGTLGEDTSRLLGSFVVARVWQAALARAGRPEAARPDCALYVDEVHNYLNLPTPLDEMLAEARGYHLSLCLAHQHLAQLPKEMREAIAANARSKLYFQLSPHDAQALAKEVEPELAAHDLAHLPRHSAAVRLCRAGETGPAFTLTTQPLPPGDPERAQAVRADARRRNGRAREQVEALLVDRQTRPWRGRHT
ncbi:MAG TPA: TraM recognition domain-containing protein [Gaiellaceae bacterium]|nr:TraM recognition domain-containing protein [Gaiellaceae bacterium]